MEKRIIDTNIEIRQDGDHSYIEGMGIVFNAESQDLGGFREIIHPDALKDADMSDIIVRAEHSNDYVLGRTSNGTAEVQINENGASYRAQLPNTTAGNDVKEYVKRGDLKGSSFAFSGVTDEWEERSNGEVVRTITQIKRIHDVGPVFNPAYKQTDNKVALRSLEEWRKENEEIVEEKPKAKPGLSLSKRIWLLKAKGRN